MIKYFILQKKIGEFTKTQKYIFLILTKTVSFRQKKKDF